MVEYFYDHQTDQLSITLGDFAAYQETEELAPGVIVHIDGRRRTLGVEIRDARMVMGVRGLQSFEAANLTSAELSERMQNSVSGRAILRLLHEE